MRADLPAEALATALDVVAEGLIRALEGVADAAGWLSDVAGDAAETTRWWAVAMRHVP